MRARACYAAAAAALGLLAPAEGLVLNGMSGLQLPRTRHSAPCHVSHRRGVAMTAAGAEITTEVKPWMSEGGARAVTNAEVLTTVALTGHLGADELGAWLDRRGYAGATKEAMTAKVLAARNGDIQITQAEQDLERAAMMFAQADIYEEEAQKLEKEATGYVEEGRKFGPQMLALTEKIGNLDPEADRDRLNAAQAKLDELIEKRRALDEKFEEVDAERSEKQTNCNWDREDAGILRNDALKALSVVDLSLARALSLFFSE